MGIFVAKMDIFNLTNNDNSGTSYYMVMPFTPSFFDMRADSEGQFPTNPYERSNPLQTVSLFDNEETVWRLTGSGNLGIQLMSGQTNGLRFTAMGGVDYFSQKNVLFSPPELQYEPNDGLPGTSTLSSSANRDITLTSNFIWDYNTSSVGSTLTVGVQYEDRDLDISRTFAQGLTAGQQNISSGVQTTVLQDRLLVRDLGFFAQEEVLLFDERAFFSLGLRADRSSVNGDPNKYYWFPKAAGSYRFDNVTNWLEGFKVRAAWGSPVTSRSTARNSLHWMPAKTSTVFPASLWRVALEIRPCRPNACQKSRRAST